MAFLSPAQAERLRRMLGKDDENSRRPGHVSADDLSDGFILGEDDRRLLSYKVRCLPSFSLFSFFSLKEHSF